MLGIALATQSTDITKVRSISVMLFVYFDNISQNTSRIGRYYGLYWEAIHIFSFCFWMLLTVNLNPKVKFSRWFYLRRENNRIYQHYQLTEAQSKIWLQKEDWGDSNPKISMNSYQMMPRNFVVLRNRWTLRTMKKHKFYSLIGRLKLSSIIINNKFSIFLMSYTIYVYM